MGCEMCVIFFFQAEDGIRDLVRSRGLGDVYKRQDLLYVVRPAQFVRRGAIIDDEKGTVGDGSHPLHLSLIHI